MTEQENINHSLQTQIAIHAEKFNSVMEKVDATNEKIDNLISEMRDRDNQVKAEMRDRDNRRAEEIAEIRQSVQSIQESGRNQTIVTFLGIAAMVVAVLLK